MKILILGKRVKKRFIFGKQGNSYHRKDLMHALVISPFIRKKLQMTFYANETTSPLHCRPCRDGEHILEFPLSTFFFQFITDTYT